MDTDQCREDDDSQAAGLHPDATRIVKKDKRVQKRANPSEFSNSLEVCLKEVQYVFGMGKKSRIFAQDLLECIRASGINGVRFSSLLQLAKNVLPDAVPADFERFLHALVQNNDIVDQYPGTDEMVYALRHFCPLPIVEGKFIHNGFWRDDDDVDVVNAMGEVGSVPTIPWYQSLRSVRTFRPWISIRGTLNLHFLERIRRKIVNWVFRHPGAHKTDIIQECGDFLSPPSMHEIIDAMEGGGLLRREEIPIEEHGLSFSEKVLLVKVMKEKIEGHSSAFFVTTKSTSPSTPF
eukprot:TRINITY_DN1418_c0_g2_i1.p1 TRINITY_DN1418_c0_g2~~TRINITY_DN1418_c0_g2_i1.p1  ORF type:complete len:292 (+),score=76.60 TRINITY_DN1418_c0_g2_i1:361-1236(+)